MKRTFLPAILGALLVVGTAWPLQGAAATYVTNTLQTVTFALTTIIQEQVTANRATAKTASYATKDFLAQAGFANNGQLLFKNGSCVVRVRTHDATNDFPFPNFRFYPMGPDGDSAQVYDTTSWGGVTNGLEYAQQGLTILALPLGLSGTALLTTRLPGGATTGTVIGECELYTAGSAFPQIAGVCRGTLTISARRTVKEPASVGQ